MKAAGHFGLSPFSCAEAVTDVQVFPFPCAPVEGISGLVQANGEFSYLVTELFHHLRSPKRLRYEPRTLTSRQA
jgi:hypothetical protein